MAEALALIGLVANVFQFVEQGWNILSASKEVYHSAQGTTKAFHDLRLLVEDITYSSERASKSASSFFSVDEIAIRNYAAECTVLAQELLALLDKLTAKAGSKFRVIESLKVGLHGTVKKKDLEKLQWRLKDLDERMRNRLSNVLGDRRYSSIVALIQDLDEKNKRMDLASTSRFERLRQDISIALIDSKTQTERFIALLAQLQNQAEATATHQRILASLMFDELKQRYSDIEKTYDTTSDWIFDPARTKFNCWLESGSGIFWISGLAGSGKSTLMKYLCNQERTKRALKRWAGHATLVVANFFFWHQGTRMQKSQQGLLQSLMFQLLRNDQDLWTKVCPDHSGAEAWSLDELQYAMEKLSKLDPGATKFCFFIDGLDEYDGAEMDVVQIVKELANCQNIKLCISSRPWNAFKYAFGKFCPSIALEDYTMDDIKFYIREELAGSEAFLQIVKQDPRCQEIVDKIAERAQGVWLWIFLVVRSLKRDLQSQESYNHLRRRIDEIPPTLDDYFRRIWSHIDPIYRIESARILLVMLQVEESDLSHFPLLGQHCLESELEKDDYAVVEESKEWLKLEVLQEYEASFLSLEETAKTRINDRCKDLVLVRKTEGHVRANTWGNSEFSIYHNHLGFLHRTVRDFLRQNFYNILVDDARDFSPVKSLFKVFLSLFKGHPFSLLTDGSATRANFERFHPIFRDFWQLALEQKTVIEDKVIDEFARVCAARSEGPWLALVAKPMRSPYKYPLVDDELSVISLAICLGLSGYVRRNWNSRIVARFKALGLSPLQLAFTLQGPWAFEIPRHTIGDIYTDLDTIIALLDLGCDLNYTPQQLRQSVGVKILRTIFKYRERPVINESFESLDNLYQILKVLFGRKLMFSEDCPKGNQNIGVLTRGTTEAKLNALFGMAKTRELMVLCENSPTVDND